MRNSRAFIIALGAGLLVILSLARYYSKHTEPATAKRAHAQEVTPYQMTVFDWRKHSFSTDFDVVSTAVNPDGSRVVGKFYSSPPMIRIDVDSRSFIFDEWNGTEYLLMQDQQAYTQKRGRLHDVFPEFDNAPPGGAANCGESGVKCSKVAEEVVNGRRCDKWEVTGLYGSIETIWIDQEIQFPIRIAGGSQPGGAEFSNVVVGPQDRTLFLAPPLGYHQLAPSDFQQPR